MPPLATRPEPAVSTEVAAAAASPVRGAAASTAPAAVDDAAAQQRRIVNRLKRARGQLDAVIAAVEDGAPCRDVVTQLSAVTHALNRAGFVVVSSAMADCIANPDSPRDGLTTDELEKLFLALA